MTALQQCGEVWCPKCRELLFTLHEKPIPGKIEAHYSYEWKPLKSGQSDRRVCKVCGTNLERTHR